MIFNLLKNLFLLIKSIISYLDEFKTIISAELSSGWIDQIRPCQRSKYDNIIPHESIPCILILLQIIFHFHFLMINEICNYTYTFLYIYEILNNISTLSENFHLQSCTYYLDIKSKFVSILICKICNCLHNIHLRHNHMIYTCY